MQAWFESLSARERQLVNWGLPIAVLIVLLGWLWPLSQKASEAQLRIQRKRGDLAFLQMAAPEILAAGPMAADGPANEPLVVLVDRVGRESGLGAAIASSEPSGESQLRVRLNNAPFDNVVAWLARLGQQHGVRVAAASFDAAAAPGTVNASLELRSTR